MREILFRGKRVDNGEWVFGSYVFEPRRKGAFGQTISELDRERHYIVSKKNYEFWEVLPKTVGEYTGLTDENGKRIFEGDIVTYIGEVCIVKWDDDTAKFVLENENLVCDFEEVWCNRFKLKIEVIGNVHDNPELLEVEK